MTDTEWLQITLSKLENFPEMLREEPRYGYIVAVVILFVWLVGVILGWKWCYSRPGSMGGNFWLNTLGQKTFRFWLGMIIVAMIGLLIYLFRVTG